MKIFLIILILSSLCLRTFAQEKNWHDDAVFGLHFDLHASQYDAVLGKSLTNENLKEFLLKVKPDWIQCDCKGHAGYTSYPTKVGTPSPGIVKDALRIHRDVTKELGIKLGVHYSGVWDNVAVEKNPEWQCINANGERYGNTCLLSDYQKDLEIPQMIEIVKEYDVDGFWIDGDCWGVNLCYCNRCKAEFKKRTGIDNPPLDATDPNWGLWNSFTRDLLYEYTERYAQAIHAVKSDCLVVNNWLYSYGSPDDETVSVDYISGDLHPLKAFKSAMLEGAFLPNRKKDWDLMVWSFTSIEGEAFGANALFITKTAERLMQECGYILACGGSSMLYDQPQRDGIITNWHGDIFKKVSDFVKERGSVLRHTDHIKEALIINDTDWFYKRYNSITIGIDGFQNITGAAQILSELHIPINIATSYMIENNLSDYKLIIIAENSITSDLKAKLTEYVQNGGKLIVTGSLVADTFADILGVEKQGRVDNSSIFWTQSGDRVATFFAPIEIVEPTTTKTFRQIMHQQQVGLNEGNNPIVTINDFGKGKIAGIYTDIFQHYDVKQIPEYRTLIKEIIEEMNCNFNIYDVSAPAYVHVIAREKDDEKIISLINTGQIKSPMTTSYDSWYIPTVEEITLKINLPEKPKSVTLLPSEKNLSHSYENGVLNVKIKDLYILESLIIK